MIEDRPEIGFVLAPLDAWIGEFSRADDRVSKLVRDALLEARSRVIDRLAGCIVLPGWRCARPGCWGWMGEEKEPLAHCRACVAPRPE